MKRKRRVGNRTGDSGRFAISFAGWIGIGLIVLGVAYFVLLPAAPENAAERNLLHLKQGAKQRRRCTGCKTGERQVRSSPRA